MSNFAMKIIWVNYWTEKNIWLRHNSEDKSALQISIFYASCCLKIDDYDPVRLTFALCAFRESLFTLNKCMTLMMDTFLPNVELQSQIEFQRAILKYEVDFGW